MIELIHKYKVLIFSFLIGLSLLAMVAIGVVSKAPDGSVIFRREGCSGCHSFRGRGGGAGPELTGVTARRTGRWIREEIRNPKSHNPNSRMPEFSHLTEGEIKALIKYLGER
jgi:mono/diheme cytochrome c family protein